MGLLSSVVARFAPRPYRSRDICRIREFGPKVSILSVEAGDRRRERGNRVTSGGRVTFELLCQTGRTEGPWSRPNENRGLRARGRKLSRGSTPIRAEAEKPTQPMVD